MRQQLIDACARFLVRIHKSPKTSGAALAALFFSLHGLYLHLDKIMDEGFMAEMLVKLVTVYALFEASDTKVD